jgi:phage terminase small subunit
MAKGERFTPQKQLFVAEFLVDFNATQAAIRAGYSPHSARPQGSALMASPMIRAEIAKRMIPKMEKLDISVDRILAEYARIAFCDIGEAYDDDGNLMPIRDMSEDMRRAIVGMEQEEDALTEQKTKRIKMADKIRALDSLAKYQKMFVDRVEHDVTDRLAERLTRARQRVAQSADADADDDTGDDDE